MLASISFSTIILSYLIFYVFIFLVMFIVYQKAVQVLRTRGHLELMELRLCFGCASPHTEC